MRQGSNHTMGQHEYDYYRLGSEPLKEIFGRLAEINGEEYSEEDMDLLAIQFLWGAIRENRFELRENK